MTNQRPDLESRPTSGPDGSSRAIEPVRSDVGAASANGGPEIMFWAPLPPPIGGVTRSADRLRIWLEQHDRLQGVVDVGQVGGLPVAVARNRRAPVHLFWCSTPEAVAKYSVIARLLSGEKWIYVHGGQDDERSYRLARLAGRGVYDRVFVTNHDLVDLLAQWRLGAAAEVASPFAPLGPAMPTRRPGASERLIVAIGGYRSWYGLGTSVEAFDSACQRSKGSKPSLTVVLYGELDGPPVSEQCLDGRDDIRVERDLSPEAMTALLAAHDTLLRPSTVDGDAMIVREALHGGLRVIASDVVPRPAGTETCANTATAFATAILEGGTVATGEGLGPGFTELL